MSPDSMRVRLHLYRIRVVQVLVDLPERLEVAVQDLRTVARCPWCGFKTSKVHETRKTKIKDLPHGGRSTTLIWLRRRFECTNCGERHTEDHPAFEGKTTKRLARQIVRDARCMSIRELTRRHGLAWGTIMQLVKAWSAVLAQHRRARPCKVLLVDETSLRRGHRYVTVVANGQTGEVLAVTKHRDFGALSRFFAEQGERWCSKVKVVVTDGSRSYKAAIQRHLFDATHVIDRFHAVRWFAYGLIEMRRRVQRIGPKGSSPAFDPEIFRARFLLLARSNHLSAQERSRIDRLFVKDVRLWHAWRLTQTLYDIYTVDDEDSAKAKLDEFTARLAEFPVPEFDQVVVALIKWGAEILAFHTCDRITNGRLEGQNNKLGVLKRIAYGFTNVVNFGARAVLWCPEVAS